MKNKLKWILICIVILFSCIFVSGCMEESGDSKYSSRYGSGVWIVDKTTFASYEDNSISCLVTVYNADDGQTVIVSAQLLGQYYDSEIKSISIFISEDSTREYIFTFYGVPRTVGKYSIVVWIV